MLDELQPDQWPVAPRTRPSRCTGVALSVATGLLGACLPGTGARIVALVGGPCTEGPGTVIHFILSTIWFWIRSVLFLLFEARNHFFGIMTIELILDMTRFMSLQS